VKTVASLADVVPEEALADGPVPAALASLVAGAEAVVRPRSTEEVSETLAWATASGVGVLPVGSGERVGSRKLEGSYVVLLTERMEGIEIYEPADVTLTAKSGTSMARLNEALGRHRQWLPFDPSDVPGRTVGGLVAAGESGPVAAGYGELRSHVLGATVVCGDGRVLRLGGRVVKNVAGFDLLRPLVGSAGRLGVITSVCLRAFPLPAVDRVLVWRSEGLAGLRDVARAVRTAPVLPASVVAWTPATRLGGGAALVVRLHGAPATVDADQASLERHAGVEFDRVDDAPSVLEEVRDRGAKGPVTLALSVLPSRLFEALAAADERLGEVSVVSDAYGGAARISAQGAEVSSLELLRGDVEALGGALTVRSVPDVETPWRLGSQPTPDERDLARRLEQVFDPAGVFWPCRT